MHVAAEVRRPSELGHIARTSSPRSMPWRPTRSGLRTMDGSHDGHVDLHGVVELASVIAEHEGLEGKHQRLKPQDQRMYDTDGIDDMQ